MKSKLMNNKYAGLGIIAFMLFMAVLNSLDFDLSNLWFLTPGIWDLEDKSFWRAFLLEPPFGLMRV